MNDIFDNVFDQFMGKDDMIYHCVTCKHALERIVLKTVTGDVRKTFFCINKNCDRFGLLTVAAINRNK